MSFGGREGGGAGFVVEDLHAGSEEVVAFSDGPFVFSAERAGAVGVIEAVPLVAEEGLDAIVAGEDACQGGVTQQWRFVELGEMDILGPGRSGGQKEVPVVRRKATKCFFIYSL